MKTFLVFADRTRRSVCDALEEALPHIRRHARVEVIDLSTLHGEAAAAANLAIVFGGDGSILRVARALGRNQIPTVGVNIGKLGFLAEISPRQLHEAIDALAQGRFDVAKRMMIRCEALRDGNALTESLGLNDAVVSRGAFSRLISIGLFIDGEHVTDYNGDGLIVSTPVGSTAHSLAAGGSILEANLEAFAVTPICPHTLSNRPLVMPSTRTIELLIKPTDLPVALTIDGQVYIELKTGDRVIVRKADVEFRIIQAARHSYYETLREKLGWGGTVHGER